MQAPPPLSHLPRSPGDIRDDLDTDLLDGFVDETALHQLMAHPPPEHPVHPPHRTGFHQDLVLVADDTDYAGWQAAPAGYGSGPVFFVPAGSWHRHDGAPSTRRQPNPPVLRVPISHPETTGDLRWWLAVVAGGLVVLLLTLLLLFFVSRHPLFTTAEPAFEPPVSQPAPAWKSPPTPEADHRSTSALPSPE